VPLANALLTAAQLNEPEDRFPLELYFCPQCALVQIGETVPPERLFRDYAYASSFSDTMVEHARGLVETMIGRRSLGAASRVIEVADPGIFSLPLFGKVGDPVALEDPGAGARRTYRAAARATKRAASRTAAAITATARSCSA
jgi:hypothetical protein